MRWAILSASRMGRAASSSTATMRSRIGPGAQKSSDEAWWSVSLGLMGPGAAGPARRICGARAHSHPTDRIRVDREPGPGPASRDEADHRLHFRVGLERSPERTLRWPDGGTCRRGSEAALSGCGCEGGRGDRRPAAAKGIAACTSFSWPVGISPRNSSPCSPSSG